MSCSICEKLTSNQPKQCKNCDVSELFKEHQCFCDNRSNIAISDKKSKAKWNFDNTQDNKCVCLIRIDGGVTQNNSKEKCDYLFLVCHTSYKKDAFFIELKGKDLKHALEQLISSISELRSQLKDFCLHARAALTSTPDISATKVKKLKSTLFELKKQYKASSSCDFEFYLTKNSTSTGYTEKL